MAQLTLCLWIYDKRSPAPIHDSIAVGILDFHQHAVALSVRGVGKRPYFDDPGQTRWWLEIARTSQHLAHNPAPIRLLGGSRKHITVRPATRNLISNATHETIERRCRRTCKIRCPGSQGRSDDENKNRSAVQNSDIHVATP